MNSQHITKTSRFLSLVLRHQPETIKRRGQPVILIVCTRAMNADGHDFYLSANGVWLTDVVPPQFIHFDG